MKSHMDYTKHTLENGLRILDIPMPGVKSATVFILVGAGSRYEEKEINGLSPKSVRQHFILHHLLTESEENLTPLPVKTIPVII